MKKLMLFFILMTALFSCKNPNETRQENEKLITQYFAYFNKHDWEKLADMYDEFAEFKDPTFGKNIVKPSRGEIIKKYKELNKIFPNLHDEIVNMYPSGNNRIVIEFVSTGTAADNSTFELPICTIFTIENGLITKDFTYFDNFDEQKK